MAYFYGAHMQLTFLFFREILTNAVHVGFKKNKIATLCPYS